jgi:PBP1b-binding outer membrane lipoprotein LpoB
MNYYKLVASFIFIIFFITGCAQPGKKVKGFKHDTPLIKTDVKEFGKAEIEKWDQYLLKLMLLNFRKEKKYHQ